jgi:hypothetical protein
MSDSLYFTRTIAEGTIKRTHVLTSDPTVTLTMLVQKSGKVIDSMIKTKDEAAVRQQNFLARLAGLRINGLPIIYEDLGACFDADEIMEVMAFINDGDMTVFTDPAAQPAAEDTAEEDEKNS